MPSTSAGQGQELLSLGAMDMWLEEYQLSPEHGGQTEPVSCEKLWEHFDRGKVQL